MQEHDLSFVRVEMALAQAPPASHRGLPNWLRTNLFSSMANSVATIVALLLIAWFLPPLLRWAFVSAQWTGADRTVCATVAQGGIHPEGWSGACWAFVNAKFGQFMFGRYPFEERWRVILTGVIFVALLAPLMIPRVPKKGLNAVLFFGVFPFVAFMLLVGKAIPFGLIGFAMGVLGLLVWALGSLVYGIIALPALAIDMLGLAGAADAAAAIRRAATSAFTPFGWLNGLVDQAGPSLAGWLGQRSWLWIDLAASTGLVLIAMRWLGFSLRSVAVTAASLAAAAAAVLWIGLDVGLPYVETPLWGGLMVTLVISFVGIAVSLPLGVLLALARRSKMPVVKLAAVIFIETVRGVPLITVLFMASIMLPYFLPPGVPVDKFLRALIGVALFASAYMAEVIRGGLQAIPKGQYEGADSLGLGYWQKTNFIVLPQALKLVIPGIVNSFIGLFKDTSLVSIISMFDLLGIVRQNFSDATWASPQTPMSGLVFAGFVFWLFCFGMSRYSMFMERRLDTGHRR